MNQCLRQIQAATACAVHQFKQAPKYMQELLAKRADAVNMAPIGHPENRYWPAVQCNVASAELNDSSKSGTNILQHVIG